MTQAEFEAIPIDEQWLYLESPQERRQRQRQELREIGYWTSRKHGQETLKPITDKKFKFIY